MRPGWVTLILLWQACGNDIAPSRLGTTPLRRLSNTEYLYALHDLFPDVRVALPPLPADTSASGFDNDTDSQAPSDVRISRYETIANLYGAAVTAGPGEVTKVTSCVDWSTPTLAAACGTRFIEQFGATLFRRPLTADEREHFGQRFTSWQTAVDFPGAAQLTVSAMLQSPQFLYRPEPIDDEAAGSVAPVEPYAMASRLSFLLWESVPDDQLLKAASRHRLDTEDDIRRQAERMLADPRALRLAWDFHRQWLTLDRIAGDEHAVRTSDVDPAWTVTTQQAALLESRLFVEHSFLGGGTLSDLLTSRRAFVNGEMARVYGVAAPADPRTWIETELPADQRAGVLTRVAFLAGYSHRGATSPPIRGNGVMLQLLCQLPAPPPADADLSMPVSNPMDGPRTNRMLFEERTAPAACQGCHRSLNGFGFGFENYTASGAFITEQNGLPIDPSGEINGTDVDGPFANAIELSSALQRSDVVYRCATQRWVQYALGRLPGVDEPEQIDRFADHFIASGGDFKRLLTEIVMSPMFRLRRVAP